MDAITNSCINGAPNDTQSSSQILQEPDKQDGLSSVGDNRKILDTRDLSQINLVYNNITFQIYPSPKISNERSSERDIRPRENELNYYNFSQE